MARKLRVIPLSEIAAREICVEFFQNNIPRIFLTSYSMHTQGTTLYKYVKRNPRVGTVEQHSTVFDAIEIPGNWYEFEPRVSSLVSILSGLLSVK